MMTWSLAYFPVKSACGKMVCAEQHLHGHSSVRHVPRSGYAVANPGRLMQRLKKSKRRQTRDKAKE